MQPVPPNFANLAEGLVFLTHQRATGELILSSADYQWHLYLFLGRLSYATGGPHRVRRWYRALKQVCPNFKSDALHVKEDELWEYHLLREGIHENRLSLTQAKSIISNIVQEVLFSLVSHSDFRSFWLSKKLQPIALLEVEQSLQSAVELWECWQTVGLGPFYPEVAPILKQPTSQRNLTLDNTYLNLFKLLNGENTIWDIASEIKQSVTAVAAPLRDLANQGIVELLTIPDLPPPVDILSYLAVTAQHSQSITSTEYEMLALSSQNYLQPQTAIHQISINNPVKQLRASREEEFGNQLNIEKNHYGVQSAFASPSVPLVKSQPTSSLVAYVDDSPSDRFKMDKIVSLAGYRLLSVKEPIMALPILLEYKPNLIFLDLVMPIVNGYEICAQLRRVSSFKNTPVIIITSNKGIIDRVRSKIVGASGFLAKPINAKKVLKILQKHLPTPTPVELDILQKIEV
jgi:chemotaxis family two-component system response regulator PixG